MLTESAQKQRKKMHAGSLSNKLLSHISNNYFILSQKEKNAVISVTAASNILIMFLLMVSVYLQNCKPKELVYTGKSVGSSDFVDS